jgi:hypothetical protein
MECLVRQVHGHQVNLETVKVGLWVKELVLVLVQALLVGADLTDKYTEEGSNANIGGKTVWCFIWRCYGCNNGPWG